MPFTKIKDKDRETLRHVFETNLLYLPSDIPPEELFFEELKTSELYLESFKHEYDIQDDTIELIINSLSNLDDHHKYYETAAKKLNESEERLIQWSVKALLRTDEDIKNYCKEHIVV